MYYLHGDHLGSTNVVSGAAISQQTYHAYGVPRTTAETLPTDYAFTGQRQDSDGVLYYGARYYEASLNRWTQPDSVIPDWYNPQNLNRYAYVRNNPVKYTDPTGHYECEDEYECNGPDPSIPTTGGGSNDGGGANHDNSSKGEDRLGSENKYGGLSGVPQLPTQQSRTRKTRSYLPFDGTLSVGTQVNANLFLLAIQASVFPMVDTRGNFALVIAPAVGPGAGFGLAGGLTIQGTNPQDIDVVLSQVTNYVGMSGGVGEVGGVDYIAGQGYGGFAFFLEGGAKDLFPTEVPVEVHWVFSPSFPILSGRYDFWNR